MNKKDLLFNARAIQNSPSMSYASMTSEEREAVGIEEVEEIIKDLDQALYHVKKELNL
ncbi:hypothetical protein [Tepidibacter mesophilus]|uniref:hypothetical protein n=1 Tax=Tepidibacter mesophilus TaxID=655607 RepID=UPI001650F88C|nr:hypothetical protein [Tepidibacter mesophilus]